MSLKYASSLFVVGITFAIIVLMAVSSAICTILWYSIIVPFRRRRMLRREAGLLDEEKSAAPSAEETSNMSPDPAHEAVTPKEEYLPRQGLTEPPGHTHIQTIHPTRLQDLDDMRARLALPPPVHAFRKKVRFSDSNHDGREAAWWCY